MLQKAQQHLLKDIDLAPLISSIELKDFTPSGNVYEDLLESIVSQQLSVKAASTIFARFIGLFDNGYPDPSQVLSLEIEQLRAVGLSNSKAQYIQNVAQFFLDNNLPVKKETDSAHDRDNMSNDEIIGFLTQIKGVGKRTVEMILMFTLDRSDVMPIDDLGIQQGMVKLLGWTEKGKELRKKMLEYSQRWSPYRTTACRYLWRRKDKGVIS